MHGTYRQHMTTRRAILTLLLPLILVLGGCGIFNSDDAANTAVDAFLDKLSAADYTGAAALVCVPSRSRTTTDSLTAEFDRYPRPWTVAIDAASYGSGGGTANVTITPAGTAAQQYSVGLIDENGWKVCDITPGWL